MASKIVLWHQGCLDGFASAYAAWAALGVAAEYIPANYQHDISLLIAQESGIFKSELETIYMVDFSAPVDVLKQLLIEFPGCKIVIIDHHKTALEALQGSSIEDNPRVELVLDMEHSGAVLTWLYFTDMEIPKIQVPPEFLLIEDRDLWRFKLEGTKAFCAYMYHLPFTFEVWEGMFQLQDMLWKGDFTPNRSYDPVAEAIGKGEVLLQEQENRVLSLTENSVYKTILEHIVPVVFADYFFSSDIGNILSKDAPFAAVVQVDIAHNQLKISLRSDNLSKESVDVSKIAAKFGGGGHKHAAGFHVPLDSPQTLSWLTDLTTGVSLCA